MRHVCYTALLQQQTKFFFTLSIAILFSLSGNAQCKITCNDITVTCAADVSVATLGNPSVSNCTGNVTFVHNDSILQLNCGHVSGNIAEIHRRWTGTDQSNQTSNCTQIIFVKAGNVQDVSISLIDSVDCSFQNTSPSIVGFPIIDGNEIDGNGFCNFELTITRNDTMVGCSNRVFKIDRAWNVKDTCTGQEVNLTQIIDVIDTTAAIVTCLDTIVVETTTGECSATVTIPSPTVIDACTTNPIININTTNIGFGNGPFPIVPVGGYDIEYEVKDCSNTNSFCHSHLKVIDTETPTAVCRDFTVVSLSSLGTVEVPVRSFDEGSYDNCHDVNFRGSRDGVNFSTKVEFSCADVGVDSNMVIIEVYEDRNPSLVDRCMVFVKLNDKLAPQIHCPKGLIIDCRSDYSDLSIFGNATASDACDFRIIESSVPNINSCGIGTIVRTFTAIDSSGNQTSCDQVITVQNQNGFDESSIVWPLDTIIHECDPDLDASNFLPGYDQPTWTADSCAMIFFNHEDQLYDASFPACFKVFRTWTILDMCTNRQFTHQQIIKVMDNTKPQITCPTDTVLAVNKHCTNTTLILPPVTFSDCDQNLEVSNDSPFATTGGADASGDYPLGVTNVKFMVTDKCGNANTCITIVEVKDLSPPTIKAHQTFAIELGESNGQVNAWLKAMMLDANSIDNCTAQGDLQYFIRPHVSVINQTVPSETMVQLDCSDQGLQQFQFWVVDEVGNSDFVVVNVEVQDNMQRCPGSRGVVISGYLKMPDGEPITGIDIFLNGNEQTTQTDSSGFYKFEDLEPGRDYEIVPFKNDLTDEGISTWDAVLMNKHILNVDPLDSPYDLISADVNKTGNISTLDIVALRKVILHVENSFPANTSWRFIDATHQFVSSRPLKEQFKSEFIFENVQSDIQNVDFIGVKVGDISGTVAQSISGRSVGDDLVFEILEDENQVKWIQINEEVELDGFQLSLNVGSSQFEFEEGGINSNHISQKGNEVLVSWVNTNNEHFSKGEKLFGIKSLTGNMELSSLLKAEGYSEAELRPIQLQRHSAKADFELLQNRPNPFEKSTRINFRLPEMAEAELRISDLSGKVIKRIKGNFKEGMNQVLVRKNELPSAGVYFYQLETPRFTATKKMILL